MTDSTNKIVFHRNMDVSVNGLIVGRYKLPDPSGAAWANTRLYVFSSMDGKATQARKRKWLEDDILSAYIRLNSPDITYKK